jgi:DNA-directed RNA polymerase subunit RPC12/RpoP
MLAHQGEELLIPVAIVALVLAVPAIRNRLRRRRGGDQREIPTTCPYCGARLERGAERCPACGFRVRA